MAARRETSRDINDVSFSCYKKFTPNFTRCLQRDVTFPTAISTPAVRYEATIYHGCDRDADGFINCDPRCQVTEQMFVVGCGYSLAIV